MKIEEIRAICDRTYGREKNYEIYRELMGVTDEMLCVFDRSLLDEEREKNPLEHLDEVIGMPYDNEKNARENPFYNTWPFGYPTNQILPRFLAVCRGGRRLGTVMDKVLDQSQKIADHYRYDQYAKKTVLVLTDKWNVATFKRYEKTLLHYAINDGIWYIFLLVTEYGYTQIPFLPNNRNALKELRGEKIEGDITLEDMLMRLEGMPVEYSITGSTWQPYGGAEYIFDVDRMWWEKESMAEGLRRGRIGKKARERFLESTSWIADIEGDIVPKSRALDCSTCTLRMYGKKIEWDYANGDERLVKLQEAINRLIEDCEKNCDFK